MTTLESLFKPKSVAIVGASSDLNKVGGRPLAFLKRAGYGGRIYPVNPTASEIQGLTAYPSLASIADPIEQVIVAVPADRVIATAQACAKQGVKALQVFSAGFAEGPDASLLQNQLHQTALSCGMRILGPNSLGLFNMEAGFFGTFATALDGAWPRNGGVGVATQSGAFGSYFFGMGQQRGLGFSNFVATGNELDIDVADCIEYLVQDSKTELIVVALEGCKDGRKLDRALRAARSAGKPVLAMKVGVSRAGAHAAATHTGALSGEDRVFDAVLRDAGAFRADSLQQLVDAAYVASIGPRPRGNKLLVVTTSGGIGVLAADAAETCGLDLPSISEQALDTIQSVAPLAAGRNPVDTSAGILGDLSAYARIAEHALQGQRFDMAVCYLAHIARNPAHWKQLREPLFALRSRYPQLPFVAVLLAESGIASDLELHGFAVFVDPTQALLALSACLAPATNCTQADTTEPSHRLLNGSLKTESQAKEALSALGIHFAAQQAVTDAAQAVAAANQMGWPVVLKIISPDISHKTEAGGVALNLCDEGSLRAAMPAMLERVHNYAPDARIEGFLVAKQLSGGVELLVGTQCDPLFGPVITVGAGGVLAELLNDVSVRLAPVSPLSAMQMLESTQINRLLEGYRGGPMLDKQALSTQISLLSEIAWANRHQIEAIDLNPVLALQEGAYALDALIARAAPARLAEQGASAP